MALNLLQCTHKDHQVSVVEREMECFFPLKCMTIKGIISLCFIDHFQMLLYMDIRMVGCLKIGESNLITVYLLILILRSQLQWLNLHLPPLSIYFCQSQMTLMTPSSLLI